VPSPTLIVVSGPPGAGKTVLAHQLAQTIGCPAICRDEIKEGMVLTHPGFVPGPSDELTKRTLTTFFDVLELLLRAGTTVVAEAAFQDKVWRPRLEPLTGLADIRIVHCVVDASVAYTRRLRRLKEEPRRAAHADHDSLRGGFEHVKERHESFVPVSLPVPSITVDTTNGYDPGLPDIVDFVTTARSVASD
jgi:predicted kinase